MPLTMKAGPNCMQECMHELKHHGTKERSHEQMVAICLKQCGQSKYDYEDMDVNMNLDNLIPEPSMEERIDTVKRQKYFCNICKRYHYTDSEIGRNHMQRPKEIIHEKGSMRYKSTGPYINGFPKNIEMKDGSKYELFLTTSNYMMAQGYLEGIKGKGRIETIGSGKTRKYGIYNEKGYWEKRYKELGLDKKKSGYNQSSHYEQLKAKGVSDKDNPYALSKKKWKIAGEDMINIDTKKRSKYYCRLCGREHYSDTMIGEQHKQMLNKGYKKESPKKRYKRYLIEKKGEARNINEAVGGRLY